MDIIEFVAFINLNTSVMFITVISTFSTLFFVFFIVMINLSAVALIVLGESFNFFNSLSYKAYTFNLHGSSLNCNKASQTEIFTK